MSAQKDFEKQWKSFSALIKSEIIRALKENDDISAEKVNSTIKNEFIRWNDRSSSQGIFLKKISEKDPKAAEEFNKELEKVKLISGGRNVKYPSIIPYVIGIAVSGVPGYFLSKLLFKISWRIYGATAIFMIIAGSVLLGLWQDSRKKLKNKIASDYMSQLDQFKDGLMMICEKLDDK